MFANTPYNVYTFNSRQITLQFWCTNWSPRRETLVSERRYVLSHVVWYQIHLSLPISHIDYSISISINKHQFTFVAKLQCVSCEVKPNFEILLHETTLKITILVIINVLLIFSILIISLLINCKSYSIYSPGHISGIASSFISAPSVLHPVVASKGQVHSLWILPPRFHPSLLSKALSLSACNKWQHCSWTECLIGF